MEFHPSFDLTRWNVVTTRFQTLRQLFGTAEHPHRLTADIHREKKRVALTGFHAINLGDERMNRTPFRGRCVARLGRRCFCRAQIGRASCRERWESWGLKGVAREVMRVR